MAVSVLLSGTLKNGLVDQFSGICTEAFHVTRDLMGAKILISHCMLKTLINLFLQRFGIQRSIMKNIWLLERRMELLGLLARCALMGRI